MVCLSGTLDPKGEKRPEGSHDLHTTTLLSYSTMVDGKTGPIHRGRFPGDQERTAEPRPVTAGALLYPTNLVGFREIFLDYPLHLKS